MTDPAELKEATQTDVAEQSLSQLPATSYAVRVTLGGRVRGVGFRPFVTRLARRHGLTGNVRYDGNRVEIVACGRPAAVREFRRDLIHEAPSLSKPQIVRLDPLDTLPFETFEIISTPPADAAVDHVSADYAMCEDCRAEFHNADDRHYRYAFTNCSQCGPRYTLTVAATGERADTSMAGFEMCADCRHEFHDPCSRRFQWPGTACAVCGPTLEFVAGDESVTEDGAIEAAVARLADDGVIAVKGIGGYRLMCDATSKAAVSSLRRAKNRPEKPLPVMFELAGKDGLESVRRQLILHQFEAEALRSPVRPIVLVRKRGNGSLADNIAPGLREIGVMLPESPLMERLLEAYGRPLVATSANRPGEPVIVHNDDAEATLGNVVDAFLHHDREIMRPVEDAVMRRIAGRVRPLRPGRGTVPLELELPWRQDEPVLAIGGDEQCTIALSWDHRVVISPYLGDMRNEHSLEELAEAAADLQSLYGVSASRIACDANASYATHRWAKSQSRLPVDTVWHHRAHASALVAETGLPGLWLMFTWDGEGFGEDGTSWGAEALLGRGGTWQRMASLRPFRLPGTSKAGAEPWRSAAALKWECGEDWPECPDEDGEEYAGWEQGTDTIETTAAGRVFDAASTLLCGRTESTYSAQAPMLLESLCRQRKEPVYLSLARDREGLLRSDWRPLLSLLEDESRPEQERAERFHASLSLSILQQARRIADEYPVDHVGLCGGVFQNRLLTEQTIELLKRNNFNVHLPRRLPCNDSALSYGQAAELAARGKFD